MSHEALQSDTSIAPWRRALLFGLAGLPVGVAIYFVPGVWYVFWILAAIIHETGHTLISWFVGAPALPRLEIGGQGAATQALTPMPTFQWLIWGLLILAVIVDGFSNGIRRTWALLLVLTIVYPMLAFHDATRQTLFSIGGHLSELALASVFLWRGFTGRYVHHAADRFASSVVGWYLFVMDVWLFGGITFITTMRDNYTSGGSFGLENDLAFVAQQWDISIITCAEFMLALTLLALVFTLAGAGCVVMCDRRVPSPKELDGETQQVTS